MNVTRNVLLIFVVVILCTSALQEVFDVIHTHKLFGSYTPAPKPVFSDSSWFLGNYQQQLTERIKETVGFRNDFVRLYNQVDWSFFNISHASGIIAGKEGYLYYIEGIFNITGRNVFDPAFYTARVNEYKRLQSYLMDQYEIPLLLILAPDKAHFYPEYIPSRFLKKQSTPTKYSSAIHALDEAKVAYLDFNGYFMKMKDTCRFKLYPKNGSHWSSYGAVIAFDSLSRYIMEKYRMKMPERILDSMVSSQVLNDDHGDLSRTMNLIWEPEHPSMDYLTYHFTRLDSTEKPNILFIGDSFFWQWYYPGIIENNFNQFQFWYYNQGIYPESFKKYHNAYTLDLKETIANYDLIIILQTTGGYMNLGYGFMERAFCEFFYKDRFDYYMTQIRNPSEWYKYVKLKAIDQGLPEETILCREAIYNVLEEIKKQKQ